MKGSYRILVSNTSIRYDFTIKRNITIIKGNSATGKTTLVDMIREFYESGPDSGIELKCSRTCRVLEGRDWKLILASIHETILFIDEGNIFLPTNEFAEAVRLSDNYYVIVTRESLPNLPYSVEEIYGIRHSGKYAGLRQIYNEFYHIYGKTDYSHPVHPEQIITEDSNSGYDFFQGISKNKDFKVASARGKSNIFTKMQKYSECNLLIIADGAAFGPEMDRIMKMQKRMPKVTLYLPESFEWMILKSGVIKADNINSILETPENYAESSFYFSWERFFSALLIEITQNSYLKYSKNRLNPVYLHDQISLKIIQVIEGQINL